MELCFAEFGHFCHYFILFLHWICLNQKYVTIVDHRHRLCPCLVHNVSFTALGDFISEYQKGQNCSRSFYDKSKLDVITIPNRGPKGTEQSPTTGSQACTELESATEMQKVADMTDIKICAFFPQSGAIFLHHARIGTGPVSTALQQCAIRHSTTADSRVLQSFGTYTTN